MSGSRIITLFVWGFVVGMYCDWVDVEILTSWEYWVLLIGSLVFAKSYLATDDHNAK